ncbi:MULTISPECIES: Uma2 family endonuclease [unclassified Okeania]|uniref:Uma2 family endonuclease n=1 Tax=unclassified Okeania TaxID=2634635 RepID=UPI00339022DB
MIYYPCLIAEVLYLGTEAICRGKKFQNYRRIYTLKEYVLIDSQKIMVECFRLNQNVILEQSVGWVKRQRNPTPSSNLLGFGSMLRNANANNPTYKVSIIFYYRHKSELI